MFARFAAVLFLVGMVNHAQSQRIDDIPELEQYIEDILSQNEEVDISSIMQELDYFLIYPINLNAATEEELQKIPLLNPFQIKSLLAYRYKVKTIVSVYELQYIPGFNATVVRVLKYLTTLDFTVPATQLDLQSLPKIAKYNHQSFTVETAAVLQEKDGYREEKDSTEGLLPAAYAGNKQKLKFRYDFNYRNQLMAGIVSEKDPGEAYLNKNTRTPDYLSAHVMYIGNGALRNVTIGDYQVLLGQGLLTWTGYGKSKSIYFNSLAGNTHRIKRNLSANEAGFLRGMATSLRVKDFELSLYASSKHTDAGLTDSLEINSFTITGLHRTDGELNNQNAIKQNQLGASFSYVRNKFSLSYNALVTTFDKAIYYDSTRIESERINGDERKVKGHSIDYQILTSKVQFYGEVAYSNQRIAISNSIAFNLFQNNSILLLHRYYDKDYFSPLANGFAEGSGVRNEQGVFMGIDVSPAAQWRFTGYYDIFSFPWLRYQLTAPTKGSEAKCKLEYRASKELQVYLQYYQQKKEETEINSEDSHSENILLVKEQKTRIHFQYLLTERLKMKDRVEFSAYQSPLKQRKGWLLYHDIKWETPLENLTATVRFSWFDIPDYDNRMYAYESSTPYSFSVPAYYGTGRKWYCLLRYRTKSNINLHLRYSETTFDDRNEISSGNERIPGNRKSEVLFQLTVKL